MKQFFRYLFVGALALIPLFVVVKLLFWIKSLTLELFDFVSFYTNSELYTLAILIIIVIILVLIGASLEKAGKSFVISAIDKLLEKVPAIGTIYSILKKITELFKPNNKDLKKEVVLIEYPKDDLWVPSYVLSKHKNIYVVFVPTSPNPTSGYTVIVDKNKVKPTTLTVAQASQFIISMGADFIKKEEMTEIINEHIKHKGKE